jgi:translation initiation factor 3 subunit C
LSELYRISEEHQLGAGMAIKIQFSICAAIFDYNPKISAAMKPEYWEKCMPAVEFLLKMIGENEDMTIGDHISEEQEVLEEKPYKVRFDVVLFLKSPSHENNF